MSEFGAVTVGRISCDRDRKDEAIAIATELGMKPLLERVLARREILKA